MTRLNYEKAHKIEQGRDGIVYDPKTEYKTYLTVPYSEKDVAKALGAKWDKVCRSWYVEGSTKGFEQWIEESRYLKKQGTEKEVSQREEINNNPHSLAHQKSITLWEYLRMRHPTVNVLSAKEVKAFGIGYPLKKGWVDKHGHEIIPNQLVEKFKNKFKGAK